MDRVLITGGSGLVGSAMRSVFPDAIYVSSLDYNLMHEMDVIKMFSDTNPTHVIHLAGRVGGVLVNSLYPVEFYEENILMNTHVLREAHNFKVKRLIGYMSTCVFPNNVEYPLMEHKVHLGEPHPSNFGYAYAKRMLDIQIRAYNSQYGYNWLNIIPTNVYGPNDNFNLESAHVLPALIHKCYIAKRTGTPLVVWGSGNALREFIYSEDLAKLTKLALYEYYDSNSLMISTPQQISIRDVVSMITNIMEFTGDIVYDSSKPEGQDRKPSHIGNLMKFASSYQFTPIMLGLKTSIEWFVSNYNMCRR